MTAKPKKNLWKEKTRIQPLHKPSPTDSDNEKVGFFTGVMELNYKTNNPDKEKSKNHHS